MSRWNDNLSYLAVWAERGVLAPPPEADGADGTGPACRGPVRSSGAGITACRGDLASAARAFAWSAGLGRGFGELISWRLFPRTEIAAYLRRAYLRVRRRKGKIQPE